jgi:hypothetical protein
MLVFVTKLKDVLLLKEMFYLFIFIYFFCKCVESPCYGNVSPNCPYGCQNGTTGGFFFFFLFLINKTTETCQYDFCTQYDGNSCPTINSPCELNDDGKCVGIDCSSGNGCQTGNVYCGIIEFIYKILF